MTSPLTVTLETPRLLRHQILEDLDDLWALYCNPNITKYIPDAPRSRDQAREEFGMASRRSWSIPWTTQAPPDDGAGGSGQR